MKYFLISDNVDTLAGGVNAALPGWEGVDYNEVRDPPAHAGSYYEVGL